MYSIWGLYAGPEENVFLWNSSEDRNKTFFEINIDKDKFELGPEQVDITSEY